MKITFKDPEVKAMLQSTVTDFIGAEKALATDAQAQLQQLIDSLYPMIVTETQAMIDAKDPSVAQGYLKILAGIEEADIAALALKGLQVQREQIAGGISIGMKVLSLVLKAAVLA